MLFLLRTIRRKLLTKNKLTTYLLYAAGEIILVVVGILIAVQINNLNKAQSDREKELSYLSSYQNDLNENIVELDRVIKKSNHLREIADTLIFRFVRQQPVDQPTLDSMVIQLVGYTLYLSKEGTIENLLGAGSLEIIQNLDVRSSFVTHEADQKRIRELEKGVFESFSELLAYLKVHTKMYNFALGRLMIDERTQSMLMSDKYFLNVLDDISFKYNELQQRYFFRQKELKDLLTIVAAEIQNLR